MSEFYNCFEKKLFFKSRCLAGWYESFVLSLAAPRLDILESLAVAMVAMATCTEFFNLHLIKSWELYSFLPSCCHCLLRLSFLYVCSALLGASAMTADILCRSRGP
jgi:hypothetical protein